PTHHLGASARRSRLLLSHTFSSSLLSPPPRSTLFPYTTLFRSRGERTEISRPDDRSDADGSNRDSLSSRNIRSGCAPAKRLLCEDRKSTRLNSSHVAISYAVFCLKKKKENISQLRSLQIDALHN